MLNEQDWRRENVWLRMMLIGPSGAGKTLGALEVASKLFDGTLPVVGVDTEHGRMRLYADRYGLAGYATLEEHSPERWLEALTWAYGKAPGGILVLDSWSHEWMGKNGILQQADRFGDWKVVRPKHTQVVEAIAALPMHVIVCTRAKMKYEVSEEEDGGRTRQRIRKLGVGPIQDDATIYDFDVVAMIDAESHEATFSNRCGPLVDTVRSLVPGDEVAGILTGWLSEGEPPVPAEAADDAAVAELVASLHEEGIGDAVIEEKFAAAKRLNQGALSPDYVVEQLANSRKRLEGKRRKPPVEEKPPEEPKPVLT